MSSQCIYWKQNKIKVRYAANTLSASVANAIEFLKTEGFKEFQDSEATIKFITIIDRFFDFLNTRNPFGKNFKQPLTTHNFHFLKATIQEHIEYLFSLQCKNETFLKTSGRKTFLYGLIISAKSILSLSEELLFSSNICYKYILSYTFSQDHLELLFAKIRSRNGHNNNPNALQLKYSMRQILLRNNIKSSNSTNCLELDNDPIGSIFDFTWKKKRKDDDFYEDNVEIEEYNADEINNNIDMTQIVGTLEENILYYIAGYIAKKLQNIDCYSCVESLITKNTEHNAHCNNFSRFFDSSNNGGLIRPSLSVYKVVLCTEKEIQMITSNLSNIVITNLYHKVIMRVKNVLVLDNCIFTDLNCRKSHIRNTTQD